MGLGLYLTGRFYEGHVNPEAWAEKVAGWFEENSGEPLESLGTGKNSEGAQTVYLNLHPCAEDVEISVPAEGLVIVSGKTSTVGPGYHCYVADLVRQFGHQLGVSWDEPDDEEGTGDETGYFRSRNRSDVEEQFLGWLKNLASVVLEQFEGGSREMMVSMPLGHRYPHSGPLVTPLGPRDLNWLRSVCEDPTNGVGLFPWWTEGIDAGFFFGRALSRIWKDVRWRVPVTDDEADVLESIHNDLTRAYELDSNLPYPWREWREMWVNVEAYSPSPVIEDRRLEHVIEREAKTVPDGPRAGYRRFPVRVDLSGWSIEIPGEMYEDVDDDGTWSAWDGTRSIYFSSFVLKRPGGKKASARDTLREAPLPDGKRWEHRGERTIGTAVFSRCEEDIGGRSWQLNGRMAVDGTLAVCEIIVPSEADRDWALSVWRSIDHNGSA